MAGMATTGATSLSDYNSPSTLPETAESDQGEGKLTQPPPESAATKLIPTAKTAKATRGTHRIRRQISRITKITEMGEIVAFVANLLN